MWFRTTHATIMKYVNSCVADIGKTPLRFDENFKKVEAAAQKAFAQNIKNIESGRSRTYTLLNTAVIITSVLSIISFGASAAALLAVIPLVSGAALVMAIGLAVLATYLEKKVRYYSEGKPNAQRRADLTIAAKTAIESGDEEAAIKAITSGAYLSVKTDSAFLQRLRVSELSLIKLAAEKNCTKVVLFLYLLSSSDERKKHFMEESPLIDASKEMNENTAALLYDFFQNRPTVEQAKEYRAQRAQRQANPSNALFKSAAAVEQRTREITGSLDASTSSAVQSTLPIHILTRFAFANALGKFNKGIVEAFISRGYSLSADLFDPVKAGFRALEQSVHARSPLEYLSYKIQEAQKSGSTDGTNWEERALEVLALFVPDEVMNRPHISGDEKERLARYFLQKNIKVRSDYMEAFLNFLQLQKPLDVSSVLSGEG